MAKEESVARKVFRVASLDGAMRKGKPVVYWFIGALPPKGAERSRSVVGTVRDKGSMNIKQYLNAKYGGKATTMLYCEAKAFGIPYPLPTGWLEKYGDIDISIDTANRLKDLLQKSDKLSAIDGLKVLDNAWLELKSTPDVKSPEFLHSKSWKRLRYKALKLHGMRCQCCGASPTTGAMLNVDHVLPRLLFPQLALQIDNLQVLCSDCNEGKANWDMTNFKEEKI